MKIKDFLVKRNEVRNGEAARTRIYLEANYLVEEMNSIIKDETDDQLLKQACEVKAIAELAINFYNEGYDYGWIKELVELAKKVKED